MMLEIQDIRVDNLSRSCVTDNSAPEVSFSLRSDIPETFLRNAVIQLGDRVFPCGKEQTGIVLDGLNLKPFTSYAFSIHAEDNHGNRASETLAFQTGRRDLPWEAKWTQTSPARTREEGISGSHDLPQGIPYPKACETGVHHFHGHGNL